MALLSTVTSPYSSIDDGHLRCLPYFYMYVIGATKSGTRDLSYALDLHPDIVTGSLKEYMFWNITHLDNY